MKHLADDLNALRQTSRLRHATPFSRPHGPWLQSNGRTLLNFSSNDYLGLRQHPTLLETAINGLRQEGLGAGASPLVCGTLAAHSRAQAALARTFGYPDALLFSSGWAVNAGVIPTLWDERDLLLSDAHNHASIIAGCRLAKATRLIYRHVDADHLETLLHQHRHHHRRAVILTEAAFSMDGDWAPLPDLDHLRRRFDADLLVDEAHSFGLIGPAGAGACAEHGIVPDLLVVPMGKALGLGGAGLLAQAPTLALLRSRCSSYLFSTSLAIPLAAAVPTALDLVAKADSNRNHLLALTRRLRNALAQPSTARTRPAPHPIFPWILGSEHATLDLSARLRSDGLLVQAIRPPTVPPGTSRLRIVLSAMHSQAHLDTLLAALPTDSGCSMLPALPGGL